MKVGDLVRLIGPPTSPIGLVVGTYYGHHRRIKVHWLGRSNYVQYRSMNDLEVISESR